MEINTFKDINNSLDDVPSAIEEADQNPQFLEHQIKRMKWALEEIENIKTPTECPLERALIGMRSRFELDLENLKSAV